MPRNVDLSSTPPDAAFEDPSEQTDRHPLGPLVSFSEDRSNLTRLTAVAVLAGSLGILGFAWHVNPDPKGVGTHRQLGLGPCGFLLTTGLPCPTCGMTTSFAYAVRGRLISAFWSQPAGTLLALATTALACVAVVVLIAGRRVELNWYRINPMHVLVIGLTVFLGSWVFKIVMVLLTRRVATGGT
ncbi:MAG: DUF2752 domain-containing protein [Phycisphaerae bacterium]|nr:DUF2752 domain-containing protein [Phycisphaerae bacterium]